MNIIDGGGVLADNKEVWEGARKQYGGMGRVLEMWIVEEGLVLALLQVTTCSHWGTRKMGPPKYMTSVTGQTQPLGFIYIERKCKEKVFGKM